MCYDELFDDDYLTLAELSTGLGLAYGEEYGRMPFELIGFDACLMASIDVAAACAGYGRTMVASQETEPGCGWQYDGWLGALAADPGMDGEKLGAAICDSYYDGCETVGRAEKTTLSVLDLGQVGGVVEALEALGREGIEAALQNGPTAFFADYSRGALRAEAYSDGGPGMVDLAGLVRENQHLFPGTADALLNSVESCVLYQRTGAYRADSTGISAYFPYGMDAGQYESYAKGAASYSQAALYGLLVDGEFSDEALDYLQYLDDFDGSLLDEDYGFVDVDAFGLEDWAVDILEEDGFTWAQLNLGPDIAEALQRVTFMLACFPDEEGAVLVLGEDFDIDCDWENGVFTDNFRGVWGAIDGQPVMMTVASVTDDYILYEVPILLNGEACLLSVSYLYQTGAYELLTATPDSTDGVPGKAQYLLMPGDEVTPLLYYAGADDSGDLFEGETIVIAEGSSFHEYDLPDGAYGLLFVMTDCQGNTYMSEMVGLSLEDGVPFL